MYSCKCSSVSLQIPKDLPCSVSLQPGPDDKGKVNQHLSPLCVRLTWMQVNVTSVTPACVVSSGLWCRL